MLLHAFARASRGWRRLGPLLTPTHTPTPTHTRTTATFTSSHFRVDEATMTAYLTRKALKFKVATAEELAVRVCPLCTKPHGNKADNLYKLYISRATGQFYCHRCGSNGSWFDLKARLGDISTPAVPAATVAAPSSHLPTPDPTPLPLEEVMTAHHDLLTRGTFPDVLSYCVGTRGLHEDTLREYLVGALSRPFRTDGGGWSHEDCVAFPWVEAVVTEEGGEDRGEEAVGDGLTAYRTKLRSVSNKAHQVAHPKGGAWGMFGMHTVPPNATEIVITEGEFDAMAVRQATGAHAVSLPNGARSLPVALLPWLERFHRVILWLDDDATGRDGCEKLVAKLGVGRCVVVRPPPELCGGAAVKDANEALVAGCDLKAMLASAAPPPHDQIVTFEDLRAEVYTELTDPTLVAGTPYTWLPGLQALTKGHRPGELTIVTGATGAGKTTFLSQQSLDLCAQGIPTLWGSFEIKNVRLLQTMLTQLHGASLAGVDREAFDAVGDAFAELPMYFLKFFGSTDVDRVLDALEYATYVNDVEHVVLDNLQFMMGSSAGKGFERFDSQEKALDKFRQFASNSNVHITLVVHPRKEPEGLPLSIGSVFGTSKSTQEADNVLILQATEAGKYVEVKKNRFDGTLGKVHIAYDQDCRRFKEVEAPTASQHPPGAANAAVRVSGPSSFAPVTRPTLTFAAKPPPRRVAPRPTAEAVGAPAGAVAAPPAWVEELDKDLLEVVPPAPVETPPQGSVVEVPPAQVTFTTKAAGSGASSAAESDVEEDKGWDVIMQ